MFSGKEISSFKKELKDVVINLIEPLAKKLRKSEMIKLFWISTLNEEAQSAQAKASKTISEINNLMGLSFGDITAIYNGKKISQLPDDLFIPPEYLRIILEEFEGPLDLLLYLVKKQNIDITDLPIFPITEQYMTYISFMEEMHFELASDYLVMASTLTEIKSRLLLPVETEDEEEDDPCRSNKRLLEYQKYKNVSEQLENIPRNFRDFYVVSNGVDAQKNEMIEI